MSHALWERIWQGTSGPADEAMLPEAVVLEDRLLFNAVPLDIASLAENADGSPTLDGAMEPADGGEVALLSENAQPDGQGPLAVDQYLSVNPEDRIVAKYSLGGTDNPLYRNLGWGLPNTGWEVFIEKHLQPVVDAGVSRLELHTPFGPRSYVIDPETGEATAAPGEWGFQFDAYLDAQTEAPKVTEDFVSAFQDFFAKNRATGDVQEVIAYIGSPRLDPDQMALVDDPQAWWDRAYDVLVPMLDAGFRSIGFDASARVTPDTLDYELHDVLRYPELRDPVRDARLIEAVGDERVEVYLEAVTRRDTGRTDYPLLLLDWAYIKQDPERPGTHFESRQQFYEHDRLTGEVIRMIRHEQWQTEGNAPIERILLEGNTAAVTPTYFLRPDRSGADTMEGFVDTLDLPSLPTLVDLDPDDLNSATAEYEITAGPKFGTLTPNRFHADVFTYTPNAYFSGIDSIQYTVRDASGATATAVVQFFVNTEVVLPTEPPAPPVTPPVDAGPPPVAGPVDPPPMTPEAPPDVPPAPDPGTPSTPPVGEEKPSAPAIPDPQRPAEPPGWAQHPGGPGPAPVPPATPPVAVDPPQQPSPVPPESPTDPTGETPDEEPASEPPSKTPEGPPKFNKGAVYSPPAPVLNGHLPSDRLPEAAGEVPTTAGPPISAADAAAVTTPAEHIKSLILQAAPPTDQGRQPAPVPRDSTGFVFLPHANRLEDHAASWEWNDASAHDEASIVDEREESKARGGGYSVKALDRAPSRSLGPENGSGVLRFLLNRLR